MKIKEVEGDALSFSAWNILAHCCNCRNTFSSGIALQIKTKFPMAYAADTRAANAGLNTLGRLSFSSIGNARFVFNLYGQQEPGNGRQVNYEGLYMALEEMRGAIERSHMAKTGKPVIAFPYKMAADRAGGDWRIVRAMIETIFESTPWDVYIVRWVK